jgi:hypothetical protein
MRLQQTILEAITAENFRDRKYGNTFILPPNKREAMFEDVLITIQGHKWESAIQFNLSVDYEYDKCEGDNDTPPTATLTEIVTLHFLSITVDGIRLAPEDEFLKQVKEKIKEQLKFEIE